MFWDATNGRLGIGTNAPTNEIHIQKTSPSAAVGLIAKNLAATGEAFFAAYNEINEFIALEVFGSSWTYGGNNNKATITSSTSKGMAFLVYSDNANANFSINTRTTLTERFRLFGNTGNVLIQNGGTFTDGGQRLQVQGTTLLNGNVTFSSATGMTWDATNSRLGIGTNAPADPLHISKAIGSTAIIRLQTLDNTGSFGYSGFNCYDNSGNLAFSFAYGNPSSLYPNTTIIGPRNATGRLQFIAGAGASTAYMTLFPSGNIALQNGGTFTDSGERLQVTGTMKVTGDVAVDVNVLYVDTTNNRVGIGTSTPSRPLSVVGLASVSSGVLTPSINSEGSTFNFGGASVRTIQAVTNPDGFALNIDNSGTGQNRTNGTLGAFSTNHNFAPTSGTSTYTGLNIANVINQTGGANGITRGLYVNPTITAAADWRSIEWSNNSGWGLYGEGTAPNFLGGNTTIRGTGTNSGATLFQVRNSASANALTVRGDRAVIVEQLLVSDGLNKGFNVSYGGVGGYQFSLSINDSGVNFSNGALASRPVSFSMSTGEILRISQNFTAIVTNNFLVGSTTNSGERLQVTGTTLLNGNVTFSSATGMTWDATNSRLGIGTNAPQGPLHINTDITLANNGFTITRTGISLADANFQITNGTNTAGQFLPTFISTSNIAGLGGFFSGRFTPSSTSDIGLVLESRTKAGAALSQGWIARFRSLSTDYVGIAHNGNLLLQNGGTFTDSGERLQVTGTMKVTGVSTFDTEVVTPRVKASASGNLLINTGNGDRYTLTVSQLHPNANQSLGRFNLLSGHWGGIYGMSILHLTDNTTSSTTLNASAKMQLDSTTQGFLPPRGTNAQMLAIATPATGLVFYDTTNNKLNCYDGTNWQPCW
jgi:hypothetical protein